MPAGGLRFGWPWAQDTCSSSPASPPPPRWASRSRSRRPPCTTGWRSRTGFRSPPGSPPASSPCPSSGRDASRRMGGAALRAHRRGPDGTRVRAGRGSDLVRRRRRRDQIAEAVVDLRGAPAPEREPRPPFAARGPAAATGLSERVRRLSAASEESRHISGPARVPAKPPTGASTAGRLTPPCGRGMTDAGRGLGTTETAQVGMLLRRMAAADLDTNRPNADRPNGVDLRTSAWEVMRRPAP
jgi:hypothetical protein